MKEHDVLYLRWKYYAIKDIDPRVRKREREGRRERERGKEGESFIQANHNSISNYYEDSHESGVDEFSFPPPP